LADETNARVYRTKYRGTSGQKDQIYVAVEYKIGGVMILILIECKRWNSKVTLEEVLIFENLSDAKLPVVRKGRRGGIFYSAK